MSLFGSLRTLLTLSKSATRLCTTVSDNVYRFAYFSTTKCNKLKEIKETTSENVTTVEGISLPSDRKDQVWPMEAGRGCILCQLNLDLKYTDVLILNQFLRPNGEILPMKVTHICGKQHHRVQKLVTQARRAGLLAQAQSDASTQSAPTSQSYRWKRYNVYFEEDDD